MAPKKMLATTALAAALAKAGETPRGHTRFLQVATADKNKSASFWRAGVKHTADQVNHPIDKFDDEQMEALLSEPKLKAAIVDVPDPKAAKAE